MEEKKKKARGGSYKEHEEYKKRTRPVSIADMVPVKGPIIEAGMGSARKAAVKLARKLMEKTKGAEKDARSVAMDVTKKTPATKGVKQGAGFDRLPPVKKGTYLEEMAENAGGLEDLHDISRLLKEHGVPHRRTGNELVVAEEFFEHAGKKPPTEMFSIKKGDAERVLAFLGY